MNAMHDILNPDNLNTNTHTASNATDNIKILSNNENNHKINTETVILPQNGLSNIKFQNVSFHYNNGTKLIDNMSFQIESGSNVAIVGPSGSGTYLTSQLTTQTLN